MPLRVAAYCRVSTDREDQANSLHSQRTYFREYIEKHPDWIFFDIFADEGLSGTSTKKRTAFNRMVEAAETGKLDLILTKEVSRFARNTVDALNYTRRFKERGVGVFFINDNIDTRENDGELRLTIMASIAQEESRKTSSRVKWGQQRRMEAGVVFGNNTTYGYETKNGSLTVKPEEASVIRLIFHKFLNEGKGTHVIARELYEASIPPPKTATGVWSSTMIHRILKNEKHVGDLLQKKYVTPNYLTHKKVENHGLEEMVYLRGHHEAIIDRATWEAAQRELQRRSEARGKKTKYSNRYWCSGKIHCSACGSRFTPRATIRPNGDIYKVWGCHNRIRYGNWKRNAQGESIGCNMRMVNEKSLTTLAQYVLNGIEYDSESMIAELLEDIRQLQKAETGGPDIERIQAEEAAIQRKKEKLLDAYFSEQITDDEMTAMKKRYNRDLEKLAKALQNAKEMQEIAKAQQSSLEETIKAIRSGLSQSEELYREAIESITVFTEYIDIKVNDIPTIFRIWYSTHGKRSDYATKIDRCELLE